MRKNEKPFIYGVWVGVFIALITCLLPFRILVGFSTMLHEYAHKSAAESYGLHPTYSPNLKTFFGLNLRIGPGDMTYFSEGDQQKIRTGESKMQQEIILAGIKSDLSFAKWTILVSLILLLIASITGPISIKIRSRSLGIVAVVCGYLLLITTMWLFWQLTGSLYENLFNPLGDLQKLLALAH